LSLNTVLIFSLVLAALVTVMTRSILRAAIGLALTSVILTIIMFKLNAPLAAVFELSVCAGLISVLFISTISLTQPYTTQEILKRMKEMFARFRFLPLLIIALAITMSLIKIKPITNLPPPETVKDARIVLWSLRHIDMLGQILILLTGVFGVVIFFKQRAGK
jgi:NADH-quinone oxidoreductase subunit J